MGLELRPAAKILLSERGYDPVLGARPLRRTIQREIEDHLSEKILFGELKAGQIVIVDVEGTGDDAKFAFKGVPRPDEVPGAPPADIASESKAACTASELNAGPVTCGLAGRAGCARICARGVPFALPNRDPGVRLAGAAGPRPGVEGRGDHGASA
jgi:hypothetical protein